MSACEDAWDWSQSMTEYKENNNKTKQNKIIMKKIPMSKYEYDNILRLSWLHEQALGFLIGVLEN